MHVSKVKALFATLLHMRVIAGEFRGRNLLGPESDVTRPITDRVKQSLFDILTPYIEGAMVYDCFAGTGSMGLECLSRGAKQVTFFEIDKSANNRLRKNIDTLCVGNRCLRVTEDIFKWFADASNSRGRSGQTDIIFLDPPYRFLKERPDALLRLAKLFKLHHLGPEGMVVFRHDSADSLAIPSLPPFDVRTYGSMTLEFLRPLATDDATDY